VKSAGTPNLFSRTIEVPEIKAEYTTVWSFPERGNWATHNPKYRGNFAPQIARNIIEMYSQQGEYILDPMVGGGTTLIEAKLLGRNALGLDINPQAVKITQEALNFDHSSPGRQIVQVGDARTMPFLKDNSIDLILTHPPYLNIIKYSEGKIAEDLSNSGSLPKFCEEIEKIAAELFRVLKPDRFCAILIGDTRRRKHYVPLAYYVMQRFLNVGFLLKEDIIKVQHNCTSTGYWQAMAKKNKFYLIMHEHLFVFRKPISGENVSLYKASKGII
jgi:DNA modification methylase